MLSYLPDKVIKPKRFNNTMLFRIQSEVPPVVQLRLKVEINCYEHFNELGLVQVPFSYDSLWAKGSCSITTYKLNELLGTKLRALYQRKKGRDLFDLAYALHNAEVNADEIIRCYRRYMDFVVDTPPTYKQFIANMEEKMADPDFTDDTAKLLRPGISFDASSSWELVRETLVERLKK